MAEGSRFEGVLLESSGLSHTTHLLKSFLLRSIPWSDDSGQEAVVLFIAEQLAGTVR
jgi:hypothetical protein